MAVKMVVAVTDWDWFSHVRRLANPPEVNFWAPSNTRFKALQPGELFLFKLHRAEELHRWRRHLYLQHIATVLDRVGDVPRTERRDLAGGDACADHQVP